MSHSKRSWVICVGTALAACLLAAYFVTAGPEAQGKDVGPIAFDELLKEVRDGSSSRAYDLSRIIHEAGTRFSDPDTNLQMLTAALESPGVKMYLHGKLDRIETGSLPLNKRTIDLGFGEVPVAQRQEKLKSNQRMAPGEGRVLHLDLALHVDRIAAFALNLPAEGVRGSVVVLQDDKQWKAVASFLPEH